MTTTRSRQGIAVLNLVAFLALTPTETAAPSPTWWDRFVGVFTPDPPPAPPVAVAPSVSTSGTPKSRCHIIIGGVVQEYECD